MKEGEDRPDVQEEIEHVKTNQDCVLSLNYKGLRQLPACLDTDFGDLQHVSRIYLKENILKALPSNISMLKGLVEIYAPQNEIASIPDSLGDLQQLECLDLSHNKLSSLPACIGRLAALEKLQVSNNQLTALPPELGCLQNLMVLEVMSNQIQTIPTEISKCQQLKRLLIDRNRLMWLPRELCQLPHLQELSAAGNQLLCLPMDLGRMKSLKSVYVDNNPYLHAIPVTITTQEIGFSSCGRFNFDPVYENQQRWQHLTVHLDDEIKQLYVPKEISVICDRDTTRVVSLTEVSLRALHRQLQKFELEPDDLPRDLWRRLQSPTADCQVCGSPIFSMAYPMVFEGQIRLYRLCRLALCCSSSCVHIASLSVNLPMLHPNPTNLFMAVALIDNNDDNGNDNEVGIIGDDIANVDLGGQVNPNINNVLHDDNDFLLHAE